MVAEDPQTAAQRDDGEPEGSRSHAVPFEFGAVVPFRASTSSACGDRHVMGEEEGLPSGYGGMSTRGPVVDCRRRVVG